MDEATIMMYHSAENQQAVPPRIHWGRRAMIALDTLNPRDRQALVVKVQAAVDGPLRTGRPSRSIRPISGEKGLMMLRASDSLRVVLRQPNRGDVEVVDIFTHDQLRKFSEFY